MTRASIPGRDSPAIDLAERLCRPQRIGVFGHRGVGKTTLLTMLYREAVGGRLPGLRLAAADARTAAYLADKIGQLESGQALPATLDQTELRFHLYYQNCRLELVVLDYQGEHVALGREEPIRDYLRDCDAMLLCLDAPAGTGEPASRLEAEQEVEQIVEDYLATDRAGEPHRPMALVVTKADLLEEAGDVAGLQAKAEQMLAMTRHALATHCPWQGVFAISSLGGGDGRRREILRPLGLDGPLVWLVDALRGQDEARLEQLWRLAPGNLRQLARATRTFAQRYPGDLATRSFQKRLSRARWRRRGTRLAGAVATLVMLFLGLWGYDAHGASRLHQAVGAASDDPVAQRSAWHDYQKWYPTRHLFRSAEVAGEGEQLAELERQIREQERLARLADLRRKVDDPDVDPEATWVEFLRFREEFAGTNLDDEGKRLRERIKVASDRRRVEREKREKEERERKAKLALRELERSETSLPLPALIDLSSRLAHEHAGTAEEGPILKRRGVYLKRLDERDFEEARDYSTRSPQNFFTRKQKYQQYLDRHPEGAFVVKSREALRQIGKDWDRHDYRAIRDLYTNKPGELVDLRARCRAYLSAHPEGQYRTSIQGLVRWIDKVSEPAEYVVKLKSGSFSKKVAHLVSRGAYLSVEIEVAGVRYGPSTIVKRSYEPEWEYEFPRKVRWKSGDPVRIIVTDNYYWNRKVADVTFDDDPVALRKLTGEVEVRHGTLTFSSDFTLPVLPKE